MVKSKIIFLSLFLLIFISGCSIASNFSIQRGGDTPITTEYDRGTRGVEIRLMPNMPPKEVFEGTEFGIGLEIKNHGASIGQGEIFISGYESDKVEIKDEKEYTPTNKEFEIKGKSKYAPEGETKYADFIFKNLKIPYDVEFYPIAFSIKACYNYVTQASTMVCINPYPYDVRGFRHEVCIPRTQTLGGGQGGPIAVTKIETTAQTEGERSRIVFAIYIDNMGRGLIKEYGDWCDDSNKITINEIKFSDYSTKAASDAKRIYCVPETEMEMQLEKKFNKIVCTAEIDKNAGAYTTPLVISLSYGYADIITTRINIRKTGTNFGGQVCPADHCKSIDKEQCEAYGGFYNSDIPFMNCNPGLYCCKDQKSKCEQDGKNCVRIENCKAGGVTTGCSGNLVCCEKDKVNKEECPTVCKENCYEGYGGTFKTQSGDQTDFVCEDGLACCLIEDDVPCNTEMKKYDLKYKDNFICVPESKCATLDGEDFVIDEKNTREIKRIEGNLAKGGVLDTNANYAPYMCKEKNEFCCVPKEYIKETLRG